MGSDRARRSYDESRQYRRVVPQQGRVFIEADFNEAQEISTEETRKEALDFVGPAGTPDNGYEVGFYGVSSPDFTVGRGTMYVGGLRVEQPEPVTYGAQKEWIDGPVPAVADLPSSANELVVLMLAEQEVSAVEDTALLEVALGGPDTAQRTRLVQRFERFDVGEATSCADADPIAAEAFADDRGYLFDLKTMRLVSGARLQASYEVGAPDDPCAPETQQGYLGAENQLIRVQVSSQPGDDGRILWAYDNASALYRVAERTVSTGKTTLKLATRPIDARHHPKGTQRIEVLRAAVELDTPDDYVAARTGLVAGLVDEYDPETQSLSIDVELDPEYLDDEETPVLFIRVWEEELGFSPGTPVALGGTGVSVTLSAAALDDSYRPFAHGDYWMLGLRPGMPQAIFPNRYLEAPQPPDGPRLWACPLAVIQTGESPQVLDDCRKHFDNLVELTGRKTCCIVIGPEDVGGGDGLQYLIDEHPYEIVCLDLKPGTYQISYPLTLGSQHNGLTVRACSGGVTLQAVPGTELNFLRGLVEMTYADDVTFEGIRFDRPAGGPLTNGDVFYSDIVLFAVGIRPMFCKNLTVRDCEFNFTVIGASLRAFGIFAGGNVDGLTVEGCTFRVPEGADFSAGIALLPSVTVTVNPTGEGGSSYTGGTVVRSSISGGVIRGNQFVGLSAPVLFAADIGALRIEDNRVDACSNGVILISLDVIGRIDDEWYSRLSDAVYGGGGSSTNQYNVYYYSYSVTSAFANIAYPYAFYPRSTAVMASDITTAGSFYEYYHPYAYARIIRALSPSTKPLDLHIAQNEIRLTGDTQIAGIFVNDYRVDALSPAADGAAVVDGNIVTMTSGSVGTMVLMVERLAVTGNVIAVHPSDGYSYIYSLIVVRGMNQPANPSGAPTFARVAITGNVLEGPNGLPKRPPALESSFPWRYLNHEEEY